MGVCRLGLAIGLTAAPQLRKLSTLFSSVQEVMAEIKLPCSSSPGPRDTAGNQAAASSGRSSNSSTPPATSAPHPAVGPAKEQTPKANRVSVDRHLDLLDVPGGASTFPDLTGPAAEEAEPVESMDHQFGPPQTDMAMLEAMDSLLGHDLPCQSTNLENLLETSLESASPDADESPPTHDITRTDTRLADADSQLFPYWPKIWQTSNFNHSGFAIGDFGDQTYSRRVRTAPQHWQPPATSHYVTNADWQHAIPANLASPLSWNSQIANPRSPKSAHLRTPIFPSSPLPTDRKLVAFIYKERSARMDGSSPPLPEPDPSEFFWETPVNPICVAVKDYIAPIRSTMQLPEIFASFWAITLMVTVSEAFLSLTSLL